jgi:uncharacterized protein
VNHSSKARAIGVVTGLFSGLTGVGGGPILVSLMVAVLGMNQRRAQGTTPAIILPVALLGAVLYIGQGIGDPGRFDAPLALALIPAMALPSIAGVAIGATWMMALPTAQLRRAFGVFLFLVAFSMLTRGLLPIGTPEGAFVPVPFIFWFLLGFVTGVLSGLLGIGGAMIIIPFMTLGAGISQHMAQGISLAIVAITALAGAWVNYRLGNIDVPCVKRMAPAGLLAVIGSTLLAGGLDAFWLTKIFGLTVAYFGYRFTLLAEPAKPAMSSAGDMYHI